MATPAASQATAPYFYKYSSLASTEHLQRLRVIVQEHELYLPNLDQLNDPADGRPRLAPLSEDQTASFLYEKLIERNPNLTHAERQKHEEIIRFNVQHHGTKTLQRILTEDLHNELKDYRIYSMSTRFDNMSLWAKYADNHSGYCLEFANVGPLFACAKNVTYEDSLQMDVTNPEHRNGFWFFFKRPEWSNEEEVRLVLPRGKGSVVRIAPHWLTRLIIGKNATDSNRRVIRDWARQRKPELAVANASYDAVDQKIRLDSWD